MAKRIFSTTLTFGLAVLIGGQVYLHLASGQARSWCAEENFRHLLTTNRHEHDSDQGESADHNLCCHKVKLLCVGVIPAPGKASEPLSIRIVAQRKPVESHLAPYFPIEVPPG